MKPFIHPTRNVSVQLGKGAPRLDDRTLKFSDYKESLPPPPASASYWAKVPSWPMFLNDTLGDCVIAASGHMIEQWTAYSSKEASITNSDILAGYEAVGGYVPGDPSTDNGCDMLTAVKYWRKVGFGGHKIKAFVSIDPSRPNEVKQAISLFGNVYLGLALPLTAQNQTGPATAWAVPSSGLQRDGSPGSWGGHAVPIIRYGNTLEVVTWGLPQMMTWNFLSAYADEAYAILTTEWIEANGKSPSGFDIGTLLADLKQVTA